MLRVFFCEQNYLNTLNIFLQKKFSWNLVRMSKNKVAIIGAGLAGCAMAYELSQSDMFDITIFDKSPQIATGASGNYAAILAPYLTSDNNYSSQIHTLGYETLLAFINKYKNNIDICSRGLIEFLNNEKEKQRYANVFKCREIDSSLAKMLTLQQASKILDTEVLNPCVFYPNALSLQPKSLCELWFDLSKAKLSLNNKLISITKLANKKWRLDFKNSINEFDVVIFAGGYRLFQEIDYLKNIAVYLSHGQLSVIQKCSDIDFTAMNKCYLIPDYKDNLQILGATFRDNNDTLGDVRESDNQQNLSQLKKMFPDLINQDIKIIESKVTARCMTSDHLPIVGQLANYNLFEETFFEPLSKGYVKSKIPKINYEKGLYISSGFGSKGLCCSLVAAKIIHSQILNKKNIVSDKLLEAISPQRFWVRNFKRGIKL